MTDSEADLEAIAEYYETHELTEEEIMSAEPAEPVPALERHLKRARRWAAVEDAEETHWAGRL
ncbi:hypothetical protein [Kitasatospora sp. NPDC057936]|uniref:hypothetical protein n=1 Tax=Kitasatospora sp. NPDC057936 TaxID=3346283 RepID=UPI0036DC0234